MEEIDFVTIQLELLPWILNSYVFKGNGERGKTEPHTQTDRLSKEK